MAVMAMVAAVTISGCAQNGNQSAGKTDGVADPGLPGGGGGTGAGTTSAQPPSTGGAQPTGLAGVSADPQVAVNGCLSAEDQARSPESYSAEERAAKIGCINAAVAAQINRQLPTKVDALTTLNHIDSAGPMLTYNYTVDIDGARLPPGAIEQVKTATRTTACANPQMRQTMSYGGVYAYRWADKNGRALGDLRIDSC